MSRFIWRFIILSIANALGLWIVSEVVPGFFIQQDIYDFLYVVLIFTALYIFLRPILKVVLSPLILVTLGIGFIFVNVLILYFLDFLTDKISVTGLLPLFYASLIIGFVNMLFGLFIKRD